MCCVVSVTTISFFEQHSEMQTPAIGTIITIIILAVVHAE
jgi:hypothetical protein